MPLGKQINFKNGCGAFWRIFGRLIISFDLSMFAEKMCRPWPYDLAGVMLLYKSLGHSSSF
jgi:hypothetical protein